MKRSLIYVQHPVVKQLIYWSLHQKAHVVAVDIDEHRLKRVKENLQRLQQQAAVIQGDGTKPEEWANGQLF
ncbi:Ribosomal RNA small subunit methyltransferase B [Providencia stuartii]|nr:Ribosomal RNA small subunit methyltransferase B [Providencia stuartii]